MKSSATIIVGYFVVAVAFFAAGRLTAPDVAAPVPAPAGSKGKLVLDSVSTGMAPAPSRAVGKEDPNARFKLDSLKVAPSAKPHGSKPPVADDPAVANATPIRDASPMKGNPGAKVIVLEVSDFQCPVCRRAYPPLKDLAKDFGDEVALVFKQNPLKMHRNALGAAAASIAAARQGKFWEYADVLFDNQRNLSETDLLRYAAELGMDAKRFEKDFRDPGVRARALAEGAAASELGARGTPAFFINGRKQVGWASYQSIQQQVRMEMKAMDALVATGKSVKEARLERIRKNLPDPGPMLDSFLGDEFTKP